MIKTITLDTFLHPTLGCDPEIFISRLTRSGTSIVTGSERLIPVPDSLTVASSNTVVRDGVQVELHPAPSSCRAYLSNHLQICFRELRDMLAKHPEISVNFSQVVKMKKVELDRLSEESRQLGCLPSENYHGAPSMVVKGLVTTRSAAGHIHIGSYFLTGDRLKLDPFVPLLDILVGNLSVLIDRDPDAAERRKLYGRAGEYRLPPHGLEYRTLGNFWLRSYPLMSFVMGMTQMAYQMAHLNVLFTHHFSRELCEIDNTIHHDMAQRIIAASDLKQVEAAINTNDFDLAWDNYQRIRPLLETISSKVGLSHHSLHLFDHFVKMGMDHWFTDDPITHWCNKPEGHGHGWEAFLRGTVQTDIEEQTPVQPKVDINGNI